MRRIFESEGTMNRIAKYFPDEPSGEHGYSCGCGACANCEPTQPQLFVAMPAAQLAARDAAMFAAGRKHEMEIAQAVMLKMQQHGWQREQAAFNDGKAVMAQLCLGAGVVIAVCSLVIRAWGG